ncbi:MAG TPA: serine hydrolase domain-containing protein, partial [Streptosporangiaceae bacterium]|nr:serine hydrolase domain-containing protein [Streptosporangiaceae bacterium]
MRVVRPPLPILLCLVALLSPGSARPARAAADPQALAAAFRRLDEFVERERRRQHIPGVSLALTDRDRLLRVKTYGFANLDARTPLTPDHLLEIGSITKSFTSIALLQLRDEGRFDPKAPVTEYLLWFSIESSFEPITSHDLMSHSAALPRDRDDIVSSLYQAVALRDRVVGEAPGKHFRYSNIGYQVLSYMLEELSGKPYDETIRERILQPLGMTHTVPGITSDIRPRLAVGYESLYDDRPDPPDHPLVPGTFTEYGAGDGCIASTPADMAAYVRMILNRGAGPHGRILSEDGFGLLIKPVIKAGEDWFYGYGLESRQASGHTLVAHNGGMVGYYARILQPLGMTHTVPGLTNDLRPRLAVGYESLYDDRPDPPDHPLMPGTFTEYGAGDGCIASTPADMAAYVRMLLNRGAGPRGRILSEDGFGLLVKPVIKAQEDWFYGYGLESRQASGHTLIAHN